MAASPASSTLSPESPRQVHTASRLLSYALGAVVLGILIAGFWNYHLVDGFGKEIIAGGTIGDTAELAGSFASHGSVFGILFAAVAGLAATFTACNCVVFAMLPGLACSTENKGTSVRLTHVVGAFLGGVLAISGLYGLVIGILGPQGVEALNARSVRLTQAQVVFTGLGGIMVVWSLFELGLLERWSQSLPERTRDFFAHPTTKAGLLGTMVGLFAVGRPFPVFRQFLSYAAEASSPLYGAGVMMVQGAGQVLLMILLFALLIWGAGHRLSRWARTNPYQPRLVSGLALLAGGTFFIYYWGLSLTFDIGFWGYKLGWYAGQVPT